MTTMQAIYYSAFCRLLRGNSWQNRSEHLAKLIARCRKSLGAAGILS
jgi:hypothetical protein